MDKLTPDQLPTDPFAEPMSQAQRWRRHEIRLEIVLGTLSVMVFAAIVLYSYTYSVMVFLGFAVIAVALVVVGAITAIVDERRYRRQFTL